MLVCVQVIIISNSGQKCLLSASSANSSIQEAQLMLTNSCGAFRGQSRSPNMVAFDMLNMVFISALW